MIHQPSPFLFGPSTDTIGCYRIFTGYSHSHQKQNTNIHFSLNGLAVYTSPLRRAPVVGNVLLTPGFNNQESCPGITDWLCPPMISLPSKVECSSWPSDCAIRRFHDVSPSLLLSRPLKATSIICYAPSRSLSPIPPPPLPSHRSMLSAYFLTTVT